MRKVLLLLLPILALGCGHKTVNENGENVEVTKIYNLVILDQSGSMIPLREAAVYGYNNILSVVRKAQEDHHVEQQNLISLVCFNHEVINVFDCDTIDDIQDLLIDNYLPFGATAMYDAIGISLKQLQQRLDSLENATAVVTIISDGEENSSIQYTLTDVSKQIDKLKKQGVMFVFMGTNQNVEVTAEALHIDNYQQFDYSAEGMAEAWENGMDASRQYYDRMAEYNQETKNMSKRKRNRYYRQKNEQDGWFDNSGATPDSVGRP